MDDRYPEHICRDGYADWGSAKDCINCNPDPTEGVDVSTMSAVECSTMDHYTATERRAHGRKLAKARAAAAEALRVAEVLARSAQAEGISEYQIAAELGVDRMTVRKWLGKRN